MLDLQPHLHAQLGVEVRQGLVEQEHRRLAHNRAAHGHPLPLPARQFTRLAVQIRLQLQQLGRHRDPRGDLILGCLGDLQPVGHVIKHRHMRVKRIVLEHHRDIALHRLGLIDALIANADLAAGDALQPRHHPQKRGLATARRPDDHDELAIGHVDIHTVDHIRRAKGFAHVIKGQGRHLFLAID